MDPRLCFGCFFLLAGFVMDVISTASQGWVVSANGDTSGLWTICLNSGECRSASSEDALESVRAMMVISVIISGVTLIVVILDIASICMNKATNRWVLRVVAILTFLSALLTLASVLVSQIINWGITFTEYGYPYWLAVASIVTFFLAGIFFLAYVIRYHRERMRRKKQTSQNSIKKDYPFTIPYYNYNTQQSHENDRTTPYNDLTSDSQKPGNNAFHYDYRYYPTTPLASGVYGNEDTGVINPGFRDSRSSGRSTKQLLAHQNGGNKTMTVDNYPGYFHSKPHLTGTATNTGNTGAAASSAVTSRLNTQNLYSRSNASSRVPRDVLGYPLNYIREL